MLDQNSFKDVINTSGIVWSRQRGDEAFSVAWIDFNNDNLLDLWISGHGYNNSTPRNPAGKFPALYLNNGDHTFTNLFSEDWRQGNGSDTHGTTWVDFDNDGDPDVITSGGGELGQTSNGQPNLLFVNNDGNLANEAADRNLEYAIARSRSTLWVDVNQDGLLDMIQLVALRNDSQGSHAYFQQLSDGTFADPQSLNIPGGSRYAQLADLTGDGQAEIVFQGTYEYPIAVFDISSGILNEISDQFNFPLTSNEPTSITADFFNQTSARDSIIADFDNDGDNDFFLTRSNVALINQEPSVFQSGENILGADLLNQGQEIGFSFQTDGQIAIDIFNIVEQEANLDASQIFIGASGRNPTAAELAAFSSTDTATSVNLLVENLDRPSLVLDANSEDVTGLKSDRETRGLYLGYDSDNETWEFYLSSDNSELIRAVVESTETVSNVTPLNFSNPDLNARGLSDQLWLNDGPGQFINNSEAAGFTLPTLSQSAVAGDFDNDRDLDIYVANSYTSFNQRNILYENQGDGTFTIVELAGGAAGESLGPVHLDFNLGSRLATADYDNDGALDIFAGSTVVKSPRKTYLSSRSQLFQNQGNDNNWLQIDLEGTISNRDAVGAQVRVTSGGLTQLREQNGGIHAFAQNSQRLHFGLGQDEIVEMIEVSFPSGTSLVFENIEINQIIAIKEDGTLIENVGEDPEDPEDPGTDDNIIGTDGNDNLSGGDGDDTIAGLDGFDSLNGDGGNDRLNGGSGDDSLNGGLDDDQLFGGEGQDNLFGDLGNDFLFGQGGSDLLDAGEGDDTLRGGNGDDAIAGGLGIDILEEQFNGDITLSDNQLIARGTDDFSEIEIVKLDAGGADNLIDASEVTNLDVYVRAYGGSDTITTGAQNDTLIGGVGIDTLEGGAGADQFVYFASNQRNDVITDFEAGLDTIFISAASFGGDLIPGEVSPEQFVLGSEALDAGDRFLYNGNNGKVLFDADGDGPEGKIVIATLTNRPILSEADLVIID